MGLSMETFVTVVHILVALILIGLVLLQDSKSSMGAFGTGGSNSVLGATGAATLAQKLTRAAALIFAITSIALSVFSARSNKSVMDAVVTGAPAEQQTAPEQATTPVPTTEGTAAPAAPAAETAPKK